MTSLSFYKGESISFLFEASTSDGTAIDLKEYLIVVECFTPFSTKISKRISEVEGTSFEVELSSIETAGLNAGSLNLLVSLSKGSTRIIGKTIVCRVLDPYMSCTEVGNLIHEAATEKVQLGLSLEKKSFDFNIQLGTYLSNGSTMPSIKTVDANSLLGQGDISIATDGQSAELDASSFALHPTKYNTAYFELETDLTLVEKAASQALSCYTQLVLYYKNRSKGRVKLILPTSNAYIYFQSQSCYLDANQMAKIVIKAVGLMRIIGLELQLLEGGDVPQGGGSEQGKDPEESETLPNPTLSVPPYQKEPLSSVYIRLNPSLASVNGEGYNVLARDWDDPRGTFSNGGENKSTYASRIIGEYEWTLENWKMCYHPTRNYKNYIVDQALLDESGIAMTEQASNELNGCYAFGGAATARLFTGLEFYSAADQKVALTGWKIPTIDDYCQLLGMIGSDLSPTNVMKHLFVASNDSELPWISSFNTAADSGDLLGARLIPCGHKRNTTLANGGKIYQFGERMAYGVDAPLDSESEATPVICFNMAAGAKVGSIVFDNQPNLPQNESVKFWQRNYRFCRALTDDELGYRLWRDDMNDRIVVTSLTDAQPVNTNELEKGLLRGLTVRWMNEDKTKVIAPLSKLLEVVDKTQNGGGYDWYGFEY